MTLPSIANLVCLGTLYYNLQSFKKILTRSKFFQYKATGRYQRVGHKTFTLNGDCEVDVYYPATDETQETEMAFDWTNSLNQPKLYKNGDYDLIGVKKAIPMSNISESAYTKYVHVAAT